MINDVLQNNTNRAQKINKLVTEDDVAITDCSGICDQLNNFFINIGPKMASKIPNDSSKANVTNAMLSSINSFFFEPCMSEEVYLEMTRLNEKKSQKD